MKILGWFLQIMGVLLLPVFAFGSYWLIALACGMNTTGCRVNTSTLFFGTIFSVDGWWFWLLIAAAGGMIALGAKLRSIASRKLRPIA